MTEGPESGRPDEQPSQGGHPANAAPGDNLPPGYAAVPPGYVQPRYAAVPPGYAQPRYAQPRYAQPGYAQPGHAQPGYAQPGHAAVPPGYVQPRYGTPYGGYGASGGYGPAAPKPGVIPLRPLTLSEILDGAFAAIRWNPKTILASSAVVATTAGVLLHLTTYFVQRSPIAHTNIPAIGGTFNLPASGAEVALMGVAIVLYFFANTALTGLLTVTIGQGVLGRKETPGSAWRATRPRIWALLGSVLLAAVCLVFGLALAIVLSVLAGVLIGVHAHLPVVGVLVGVLGVIIALIFAGIVAVRWALAIPVVMLERTGAVTSLRRSWQLVRRSSWRVLGILLLTDLIVSITAEIIGIPFALASGVGSLTAPAHMSALGAVATAVGGIVADTVTAPMLAGVVVLLYTDLRMRREGMDIMLQAAMAGGTPDNGAPGKDGTPDNGAPDKDGAPDKESAGDQNPGPW